MKTGWVEAPSGARNLSASNDELPARIDKADDASSTSDAFAVSSSGDAERLHGWVPAWPEAAIYVYL